MDKRRKKTISKEIRKPSKFIFCREKETWSELKKDLEVVSEHWSYQTFQLFLPFLQGTTNPLFSSPSSNLFPAPLICILPSNPEGAEDRGEAHAEKLSVLAELLKRVWDWLLPQWHNVLGAAGVHPEHSFSMDWPCSLSFVCFLPSAADEPAKEENHYEEDGCNAINREGLLV